jgi:nickel-dependent lactate racemase
MTRTLRYGSGKQLSVDPPADAAVIDLAASQGISDPAQAVSRALSEPLGYPPLAQATVPGDHVTLAVGPGVPQLGEIVCGAVVSLLAAGIEPQDMTVLLTEQDFARGHRAVNDALDNGVLDKGVAALIHLIQHDPVDRASLSYLAASKENKAIYVNRHIFDADLVLPIGCARPQGSLGYYGEHGALFPTFADDAMQQRFRAPDSSTSSVQNRRRQQEVDEAAWLLGVQMVVQIVPGLGDSVLHAIAGEARAVAQRCVLLCDATWQHQVPERVALVIAAIGGRREQQTWENVARALSTAMAVAEEDGTIVLCTDLRSRPGEALQRLAALDEQPQLLRKIRRARSPDALAAWLLASAAQRVRVYLLSGLDEDTVENLGMGYIASPDEIGHLARRCHSCLLLADAHRAGLVLADSENG